MHSTPGARRLPQLHVCKVREDVQTARRRPLAATTSPAAPCTASLHIHQRGARRSEVGVSGALTAEGLPESRAHRCAAAGPAEGALTLGGGLPAVVAIPTRHGLPWLTSTPQIRLKAWVDKDLRSTCTSPPPAAVTGRPGV